MDLIGTTCRKEPLEPGASWEEARRRHAELVFRPDGRVIDDHPYLPQGDLDRFRDAISSSEIPPIEASDWVIPEGAMDLDLAVSGLIELEKTRRRLVERP